MSRDSEDWKRLILKDIYNMKKIIDFFKRLFMLLSGKRLDRQEAMLGLGSMACPSCGQPMGYHDNGLVEIEYDYTAGGPIGAGIHISGHGKREYQFHYFKCQKGCASGWKMTEYRETPSWWDDLWNNDCPFTQGDIIQKFQNGEMYRKKYTGHRITR